MSEAEQEIIGKWFPAEETSDFFLGMLACANVWYRNGFGDQALSKDTVGKMMAELAHRISEIPVD